MASDGARIRMALRNQLCTSGLQKSETSCVLARWAVLRVYADEVRTPCAGRAELARA